MVGSLMKILPSFHQGMSYRYFELGKNADPQREDSLPFRNAFTVHPVSDPNLMYRLHKRFSQIELELTYLHIQQLQVRRLALRRLRRAPR